MPTNTQSVSCDDDSLKDWVHVVNEFASKKSMKLAALLTEAADKFVDLGGVCPFFCGNSPTSQGEEEEEEEEEEFDMGLEEVEKA